MGLYDTLHCDYPLPDPEFQHEEFQTKDMACALDRYRLKMGLIPRLTKFFKRFNAAIDRNNRTLDEALRVIEKSNVRLARLKRFRLKLPR